MDALQNIVILYDILTLCERIKDQGDGSVDPLNYWSGSETSPAPYQLRSPGSNGHCVAGVMGFCGDGFDQGCIGISGNCDLVDGHFKFDGGEVTGEVGVRPALWLKNNVLEEESCTDQ